MHQKDTSFYPFTPLLSQAKCASYLILVPYAEAGAFCKVIRAIRRVQGREADFERYYQGLFATYSRFSALKDELRKAIEGPAYRRKG